MPENDLDQRKTNQSKTKGQALADLPLTVLD